MSSCCTPEGGCSTAATETGQTTAVTTGYTVTGMTCGCCATAVTKGVSAVAGVTAVEVDVAAGLVTVTTDGEPDDAPIAAAVVEAGYELTGRAADPVAV